MCNNGDICAMKQAHIAKIEKQNDELKNEIEDWKSDHEHNLELMKGLNGRIVELEAYIAVLKAKINATTISDCPIKDEWHYPSKGELPKESGNYILAFYGAKGSVASGKPCCEEIYFDAELLRWKERDTYDDLPYLEKKGVVIAWRELPEPPKEVE